MLLACAVLLNLQDAADGFRDSAASRRCHVGFVLHARHPCVMKTHVLHGLAPSQLPSSRAWKGSAVQLLRRSLCWKGAVLEERHFTGNVFPSVTPACEEKAQLRKFRTSLGATDSSDEEGTWLDPELSLESLSKDCIYCQNGRIEFIRATFGMYDDVEAEVIHADPLFADQHLRNAESIRGKIVVVRRGSSSGSSSTFVDKANRIAAAGGLAMVVVNSEDSLIAPGDSKHEGMNLTVPVVGIRACDERILVDGEIALLSFRPVAPLTAQEKQYLLELAEEQERTGALAEIGLDASLPFERVLEQIDELLEEKELVRIRIMEEEYVERTLTFADKLAMSDISTLLADTLGGGVVASMPWFILLYRSSRAAPVIRIPSHDLDELSLYDGSMGLKLMLAKMDEADADRHWKKTHEDFLSSEDELKSRAL